MPVGCIEGGADPLGERERQLFARQLLQSDVPDPPQGLQLTAALGAGLEMRLDFRDQENQRDYALRVEEVAAAKGAKNAAWAAAGAAWVAAILSAIFAWLASRAGR